MVQDPFRLYVYWQLRENPFDKLEIFLANSINTFKMVIKLVDESNNIAVINNAPYSREYWFKASFRQDLSSGDRASIGILRIHSVAQYAAGDDPARRAAGQD
ncbi:MAG: hypothetical protein IPL01_08715 [Acidobacteria bacterium]|nr:hypothetical protein [Acidobacteriota bacterium]